MKKYIVFFLSVLTISSSYADNEVFKGVNKDNYDFSNKSLRNSIWTQYSEQKWGNEYTYTTSAVGANFTNADLTGASFGSGSYPNYRNRFWKAIFSSANLTEASLTFANFNESDFTNANLTGASLSSSIFNGADFTGANFTEASLSSSSFDGVNFTNITFNNTHFISSGSYKNTIFKNVTIDDKSSLQGDFTGSDFSCSMIKSDLYRGVFNGVNFTKANFSSISLNADFTKANFSDAVFSNVRCEGIFKDANLTGASLSSSSFSRADFSGANLTNANLKNINFSDSILSGADFTNATIEGAAFCKDNIVKEQLYQTRDYAEGILSGISLRGNFTGVDFSNKKLIECKFYGSNFDGGIFKNSELQSTTLSGVSINNCDFTGAIFKGDDGLLLPTSITETTFENAIFKMNNNSLYFSSSDFANVSFKGADFSNHQITIQSPKRFENVDFEDINITKAVISINSDRDVFNGKDIIVHSKNYKNKDLNSISFIGGVLSDTDFKGFNLKNINIIDSEIRNSNFDGADLSSAVFNSWGASYKNDFSGSTFVGADLTNAKMEFNDFSYANFKDAVLSGATLNETIFTNAIIQGADLSSTVSNGFTEAQLKSTASYKEGNLTGVMFDYNNISKWDLSNQNLQNASFFATRITNVNFTNSDLRGAETTATSGVAIYKNTIMADGVIKNFGMASAADSLTIRRYMPTTSGGEMISAKISESDATVSGGATLKLDTGARLDVVNKKTLTIAENGVLIIDTSISDPTQIYIESLAGLVIDGKLTINITEDLLPNVEYKFDLISFENDSNIASLKDLKPDESLFLTIKGETFNGYWTCVINENKFSILATQVPEPATYAAIFGALALGLAIYRRRK